MERRQNIDNCSDNRVMVFIEPEARDFWLEPGEEVEIRASISEPNAQFEISILEDGIVVCPDHHMGSISVWKDEKELECGYQRPNGWPERK